MPRILATLGLCAAAACLLLGAGVAHADSRLFSARAEQSDITVVGAELNGSPLAIAGQGGSVTFFRIDNPSGTVPCANRISFTASNGAVATVDTDICVNGAEVTVAFGNAAATQPATGNRGPAISR